MTQKDKSYSHIVQQISAITHGEADLIANMANISAILFNQLDDVNWAGFYLLKQQQLVLGPFQGQPACIRIPVGKGVCGTVAQRKTSLVVENVHEFEGHIACDAASNSEIVLPVFDKNDELIAVLDIDSPSLARFDETDEHHLLDVVHILQRTLGEQ